MTVATHFRTLFFCLALFWLILKLFQEQIRNLGDVHNQQLLQQKQQQQQQQQLQPKGLVKRSTAPLTSVAAAPIPHPAVAVESIRQPATVPNLSLLEDKCYNTISLLEWWSYVWCYKKSVRQIHFNHAQKIVESENNLGEFISEESGVDHQIFRSAKADCVMENTGEILFRYVEVTLMCCEEEDKKPKKPANPISNHPPPSSSSSPSPPNPLPLDLEALIVTVTEPVPCSYYLTVCTESLCRGSSSDPGGGSATARVATSKDKENGDATEAMEDGSHSVQRERPSKHSRTVAPSREQQQELLERVRFMFYHAYDNYMLNAFPDVRLALSNSVIIYTNSNPPLPPSENT